MHLGKTVFAQLMDFIPAHEFRRCVDRYQGNRKVSRLSCWSQFLCMVYAQLMGRDSLRDIEICLRALGSRLYHLGLRGSVARSTLADANETRDFRIYADLAQALIQTARPLYAGEDFGVEMDQTAYALDCTTIDLCLSLFPWARYRATNAAVKLHTLLDLEGSIPAYLDVKPAKIHEIHVLDELLFQPGAIYIMDRGYLDFQRLYRLHQSQAFFITRARKDFCFRRLAAAPVDKLTGLRCDQKIRLVSFYTAKFYPDPLRRIGLRDSRKREDLGLLNQQLLSARAHHHRALQMPRAGGVVFQMGQAASAHQEILRSFTQCREDPNLDRHLRLRAAGHRSQTTGART